MASQKGLGRGLGALLGDLTEEPLESGGIKLSPTRISPGGPLMRKSWKHWRNPSGSTASSSP